MGAGSSTDPLLGTALFWAAYAVVYDSIWDNAMTDEVARAVVAALGGVDKVVEAGAGTGLVTERLQRVGIDVVATEPNRSMRRRFRRRLPEVAVSGRTIGDMDLALVDGRVLVAVNVLHLTPRPDATLRQLQRLVGPTGRVVVVTPVDGLRLGSVLQAQSRLGVSRWKLMRSTLFHGLLRPLTGLARVGIEPSSPLPESGVIEERMTVAGVSRVLVYGGAAQWKPLADGDGEREAFHCPLWSLGGRAGPPPLAGFADNPR